MLKDKLGNKLERGFYVGPDPMLTIQSNLYFIEVKGDSFTAEYWDGFLPITNFEEASRHFIPLSVPSTNLRFLERKLKED